MFPHRRWEAAATYLFIWTQTLNLQMFRLIPFVKLQNYTQTQLGVTWV